MTARAVVLLAALAVLTLPPSGSAHSLLLGATPAADSVVTVSPPTLTLRFNNRIEKRLCRVRLVDERGAVAAALIATSADDAADNVVARVPPLAPGLWRVEWQVFSTDGHVVSGAYAFRLSP